MEGIRRRVIGSMGLLLVAPALARAQQHLPVVGYLRPDPEPLRPDGRGVVMAEFEDLRWREGSNLRIERAFAAGREDQLPALAEELVRKRVDVILAIGPEAAVAAARATTTIPIVFWGVGLPIEQGLIDSFARPGHNATGMAWTSSLEVASKKLEVLKQMVPTAKRVAWVESPTSMHSVSGRQLEQPRLDIRDAGKRLSLDLHEVIVRKPEDFDAAFARIREVKAQAIALRATHLTWRERARIADFALRHRLASAHGEHDSVAAGGLFSYGVHWQATVAPTVAYVDRILRGARPEVLPVAAPERYELVINMQTAKKLGIAIPAAMIARADRVIE